MRESNAKSRQEILADIGLGKRLSAVVARKLLSLSEALSHEAAVVSGAVVIHGSEGMAVQFARCCKPLTTTTMPRPQPN